MNPTITTARLRDIPVSVEACAAEIRQITTWTSVWDLTAPSSLRWKTTYGVFTLVGYSTDPLSVQDVRTEALRCFLAGGKLAPRTPDLVRDTTAAKDFPACLKVAASLPGITERVQLRVLGPRGILPRHIDPIESVPTVRFHIPITLPDGCSFFAWDTPDWAVDHCYEVCRAPGEVWFVHIFAEPHMIVNRSTTQRRDHLLVDKFLDDPLRQYLAAAAKDHGKHRVTQADFEARMRATIVHAAGSDPVSGLDSFVSWDGWTGKVADQYVR